MRVEIKVLIAEEQNDMVVPRLFDRGDGRVIRFTVDRSTPHSSAPPMADSGTISITLIRLVFYYIDISL